MKTAKLALAYLLALAVVLFWLGVVKVACLCDRETREAWKAGEAFAHFDPALARLDAIHGELFGTGV
jgi:hypothetical protein